MDTTSLHLALTPALAGEFMKCSVLANLYVKRRKIEHTGGHVIFTMNVPAYLYFDAYDIALTAYLEYVADNNTARTTLPTVLQVSLAGMLLLTDYLNMNSFTSDIVQFVRDTKDQSSLRLFQNFVKYVSQYWEDDCIHASAADDIFKGLNIRFEPSSDSDVLVKLSLMCPVARPS